MQHMNDETLADAIYGSVRVLRPRVLFDWGQNQQFDHEYSDLSDLVISYSDDRSANSHVPEDVNTYSGFSSGELKITLAGSRTERELSAPALFSPWMNDSPLYGIDVPGTLVKVDVIIDTDDGERAVRQFTGWVRDVTINQSDNQVELVCSDVSDAVGIGVTLPHWAAVGSSASWWDQIPPATARAISMTWVVEEVLRRIGRHTGPVAREDAVAYFTCNGSFLPSVGTLVDCREAAFAYKQAIQALDDDPWMDGLYGLAPKYSLANTATSVSASRISTNRAIRPTGNGESGSTTVSWSSWVYIWPDGYDESQNGTAGFDTWSHLLLEYSGQVATYEMYPLDITTYHPQGAITVEVYPVGYVQFIIEEHEDRTGGADRWNWTMNNPDLDPGWHYFHAEFTFTGSGIDIEFRIDDEIRDDWAVATSPAHGYRYRGNTWSPARIGGLNPILTIFRTPVQHMQWSVTDGPSANYTPLQKLPPTTIDGRPLATVARSIAELTFIPDVTNRSGWEVLSEIAAADFSVVHTDEWGTIHWDSHYTMGQYDVNADTNLVIEDDKLLNFVAVPSLDGYRNQITAQYSNKRAVADIIWRLDDDWRYRPSQEGSSVNRTVQLTDVVGAYFFSPSIASGAYKPDSIDRRHGSVAALNLEESPDEDGYNTPATPDWGVYAYPRPDQRSMVVSAQRATNLGGIILGYRVRNPPNNSPEPAVQVGGLRYTSDEGSEITVSDSEQILVTGGARGLVLPHTEWRQTEASTYALLTALLNDTTNPAPVIRDISIPADPRLQILDIVHVRNDAGITGEITAQVIGKSQSYDTSGGFQTSVSLRVLFTPGEWILGESVLGETTVL